MSLVEFTVTRNTQKNVINSEGFLENVGNNVPGFEYKRELIVVFDDPESDSDEIEEVFTYRGALIEPASTNLVLRSEDFNNNYWLKNEVTLSANVAISPNGQMNAYKLKATAVNNYHALRGVVGYSSLYTGSCYLKKGEYRYAYVGIERSSNSTVQSAIIDLETGLITNSYSTTGTPLFNVVDVGDGWYRLNVTQIQNSTGTSNVLTIGISDNGTYNSIITQRPRFTGDGTSGIYIWGAQLEKASESSSYIKTEGSIATRNADIIRLLNADQYTPNEGQVVLEWEQYESDTLHIGLVSGSVEPGVRKLKFIYTSTEQKLYIDDVLVDSITGNYDWSGMDKIELGNFNGTNQPTTHLRLFAINENTV